MRLEFELGGLGGSVDISIETNDDPERLGCPPSARGFPVCTADVEFEGRGYEALIGWVQLVRSSDNQSSGREFESDPFALFFDLPSPYCWYGTEPTLFDAPYRAHTEPLTWTAQSYLATTPLTEAARTLTRPVIPLVGFAWGFTRDDQSVITVEAPSVLDASDWNLIAPRLRATYLKWKFPDASRLALR